MGLYEVFDQGTEVHGTVASMFFNNMNYDEIEPILTHYNLTQVDPTNWYPFQGLLDIFNALSQEANAPENFVAVGMAAGEQRAAVFPSEALEGTFLDLLTNYSQSYPSSYRNGDPGYLVVKQSDENNYFVHVHTPYPDDVYYGALYSIARCYCQHQNRKFTLRYANGVLRRDDGGDETVYHFTIQ